MSLALFRKRRLRFRFAWLALVTLLFQQVALAAYACQLNEIPDSSQQHVVMTDCESMAKPDPQAPALCEKHCHPDYSTTPDLRIAQAPALPPAHFDVRAALPPPTTTQHYEDVPRCCCDPPLRERFCSLQI